MYKNTVKIFSYIAVLLLVLIIGVLIGKNYNKQEANRRADNLQEDIDLKTEKICVSTIVLSNKNTVYNSISESDLAIDDVLVKTYEEIMNSKSIKSKIKQSYSNVKDIELENINKTSILKVIYVCDERDETECINITNEYVSLFSKNISDIFDVNVYIVDKPSITTRRLEGNNL